MARTLMVIDEVRAVMEAVKIPKPLIDAFTAHAERIPKWKHRGDADGSDDIEVGSGYGTNSRRGFVEFILNDQLVQLEPAKAREIGLWLIECAEAAMSDEMMITLFAEIGLPPENQQHVLMKLRQIRQGTRGASRPH